MPAPLVFLTFSLFFLGGGCVAASSALQRIALHLHSLKGRERGREREAAGSALLLHFPVDCFPQAARQQHSGISREKQSPNNVTHTRILYVCLCVCVTSTHTRLSSISCHNPSKQAAIHPISQPARQPCSYPFIHPSIHLSIQLSRYPSRRASSSCRWPQLQCIMPRTYFRSRSLCRCKEFNMCFDCIVLHVAPRLTLIVAPW